MSTPVLHIHRPHRMHSVDAAYCYNGVAWSACLSVCVLDTPVNPAKTDEPPIDIAFDLQTHASPRNQTGCTLAPTVEYDYDHSLLRVLYYCYSY